MGGVDNLLCFPAEAGVERTELNGLVVSQSPLEFSSN
jgi:hypothetical protein